MTIDAYAAFSPCLRYRSPGNAPVWDDGCALYYFAALSEIPDADAPILMKAIMTGGCGKFRPDPDEVLTLWRKVTQPAPAIAEEIAGKMLLLRREKGIYQRKIPGDPYCRWEQCEPPATFWTGPYQARISLGMGGWSAFCDDNSPLGVLRAQIVKLTAAIMNDADDTAINLLRLEHLAANPPALTAKHIHAPRPAESLSEYPSNAQYTPETQYAPETHREAVQIMACIKSRTGDLRMVHLRDIDAEAA